MNLGEKIKVARRQKNLTQAELVGDKITRNMLSIIESGKTSPSLDTITYLADRLNLPVAYFFSEENDLYVYRKTEKIAAIKSALIDKNYTACISLALGLDGIDDEIAFILASAYYELGVKCAKNGSLLSAAKHLRSSYEYCKKTVYDTYKFQTMIPLYLAIADNVSAPLLEFDSVRFDRAMENTVDYEFYKYLTLDFSYEFKNPRFRDHMEAKSYIKERKYSEAINLLSNIENEKSNYEPNAYLMFCVYADMENCYKQLYNFEAAYRYASKRLSLMEGFKS